MRAGPEGLPAGRIALARSLTDTFAGIRPVGLPGFFVAERLGALAASALIGWLLAPARSRRYTAGRNGLISAPSGVIAAKLPGGIGSQSVRLRSSGSETTTRPSAVRR